MSLMRVTGGGCCDFVPETPIDLSYQSMHFSWKKYCCGTRDTRVQLDITRIIWNLGTQYVQNQAGIQCVKQPK